MAGFKALGRAIKKHVAEGRKGQITGDDIMAQTDSARKAKATSSAAKKKAAVKAGKKALRTVNPSSKKKRSLSTIKPKKAKGRSRATGVGVQ